MDADRDWAEKRARELWREIEDTDRECDEFFAAITAALLEAQQRVITRLANPDEALVDIVEKEIWRFSGVHRGGAYAALPALAAALQQQGRNWFAEQIDRERSDAAQEARNNAADVLARSAASYRSLAAKGAGDCGYVIAAELEAQARRLRTVLREGGKESV